MAARKPRTNNAIKAQARAYQKENPGTAYTAARAAVVQHSPAAREPASPFEDSLKSLVGQPDAKMKLRQMFAMEQVRAERKRREHETRWANHKPSLPPHMYQMLPKVRIVGPPGSGKSTVTHLIHDEMTRVSYAYADDVRRYHERLREEREKDWRGEEPPSRVPAAAATRAESPRAIPSTVVPAAQLLGRYIGEAQQLIQPVVERAERGLLVIEDIDFLTGMDEPFRREALTVLADEIRLLSHNLAVCVTGYNATVKSTAAKDLMGLFPVTVELRSITADDARELATLFAIETVEPRALDAIADHVRELEERSVGVTPSLIDALGNARFIRSVVEYASVQMTRRLSSRDLSTVTDEELNTLTVEDVAAALKARTHT